MSSGQRREEKISVRVSDRDKGGEVHHNPNPDSKFNKNDEIGYTTVTSNTIVETQSSNGGYDATNAIEPLSRRRTKNDNSDGQNHYHHMGGLQEFHGKHESINLSELNPPLTRSEQIRDNMLRTLDHVFFQRLGLLVLLLVVADGAFFFFLLIGAQRMCRPRTDCEPRNWWYNFSIQLLNVLFTYMALVSMPWRCVNFTHSTGLSCPKRSNEKGRNLYGILSNPPDVWFYIPTTKRVGILIILLLNCIFQFMNQGTRIYFYSFELQNVAPGNIWTNVFFASSFICAGIGAGWLLFESGQVRKQYPNGPFGLGPIDSMKEMYKNYFHGEKYKINDADPVVVEPSTAVVANESGVDPSVRGDQAPVVEQLQSPSQNVRPFNNSADATREHKMRNVTGASRSNMRLFAM